MNQNTPQATDSIRSTGDAKPQFKFNLGQWVSLGCAGTAVAIALVLVGYLFFLTTFGPGCAECSAGWAAVFAVWMAIPVVVIALLVFIFSSLWRLVPPDKQPKRKPSKGKQGKINFG
jgi:Na+/melibiose symporter-like transporter